MSHASPELDPNLRRIGYRGPQPGPDLTTLPALYRQHDSGPSPVLVPGLG